MLCLYDILSYITPIHIQNSIINSPVVSQVDSKTKLGKDDCTLLKMSVFTTEVIVI